MHQVALPVEVNPSEVARKKTLGGSIELCLELAGLEPKQIQADLRLDKAQFSRWQSGQEGILYPRLCAVMDRCGNDAPVLWMASNRGYDLRSMHKVENELQRENRLLRQQVEALLTAVQIKGPRA
jgi:hypothetical protein